MNHLFEFLERRPLMLSVLAWLLSLPVMGMLVAFGNMGYYASSVAPFYCFFAIALSVLAVINLIRAEKRGCSSTKIGLSVTALFFAFIPEILMAFSFAKL
ncbi:MAG: hypothetical protein C5B50_01410 [Verrucomicrobia bacterium]|nr:MAG: hypothetical protein C5B50_01410 [Verrucomicrobiota bacterium]